MTPQRLLNLAIIPALHELHLCGIPDTADARRFLLAIALQESALAHRRQVIAGKGETGPAASFWQFEPGGGCQGVLTHFQVAQCMRRLCAEFKVPATPQGLWEAMRYHDIIAAIAARLRSTPCPTSCRPRPRLAGSSTSRLGARGGPTRTPGPKPGIPQPAP